MYSDRELQASHRSDTLGVTSSTRYYNILSVRQCDSETNQESQTADSPAGDWQSNITPSGLGGLLFSQSELEESIRIVAGLSFTFTSATGSVSHPVISPGEPAALE